MLYYVFSLNYIKKTIKTIKTKCNPSYSNYMSNSLLTKKFLSVNRKKKKKSWSCTTKSILIIN